MGMIPSLPEGSFPVPVTLPMGTRIVYGYTLSWGDREGYQTILYPYPVALLKVYGNREGLLEEASHYR
jgi:hypothetical protein